MKGPWIVYTKAYRKNKGNDRIKGKRSSQMSERRKRRSYEENFKKQIVQLYNSGKTRSEIIKEYDLTGSVFDRRVERINSTGSSKEKDNRTPEQEELMNLRKENQRLLMENDVLKQAALILGQK